MNILQSSDSRMKAIKENTILSFNSAAKFPIDFIEFDVQVALLFLGNLFFFFLNCLEILKVRRHETTLFRGQVSYVRRVRRDVLS